MQTQQEPLILTLQLDAQSEAFFNEQRQRYFPPERNFLNAHLTLFHQLPNTDETREYFESITQAPFKLQVTGLMSLGGGVAYKIESAALLGLRKTLADHFIEVLIPQDRQGFRPHITVQNKVLPEQAKELLNNLQEQFQPFKAEALGLNLWAYLGGPWRHDAYYAFK
ncbi:2'-5' RNA ligase family protein [Mucilaginibacter auburnensis]|uniref:2'-5' RNA ligase superfamily protein n=1 Tax=Mucilaginibacter auburnensis TaxID=1457233 RepID=A0A2H9VP83_9SPHI|nr:2'-5' RNA ligase family protein [Mucilaginibacter auburnensis]PJJ80121.1 2'-5' RNA ligase superfamily protein [Mucilaginibacter auburnensis]